MYDLSNMRLHAYLEQVVGSKTSISVIRALLTHKGKVFTVRKLAESARSSPSEASLVVRQLEETGALKLQPVGRSFLVTLNEQSYVLKRIMEPLVRAEQETVGELVKLLKQSLGAKPGIHSAYLFGSVERREEGVDSDVDLLIIYTDREQALTAVSKASERVAACFNKNLSPLLFSKREFASKRNGDLLTSIKHDHILVCGENDLLR